MKRWAHWLAHYYVRAFPEQRELIVRTDGRIRYMAVPRMWQVGGAAVALVAVGWAAAATYGFVHKAGRTAVQADAIARAESTIASLRAEQVRLESALAEATPPEPVGPPANLAREKGIHGVTDGLVVRVAAMDGELDQLLEVQRELERALNESAATAESDFAQQLAAWDREQNTVQAALRAEVDALKQAASQSATAADLMAEERDALSEKVAFLREQNVQQAALRRTDRGKVRQLEAELASLKEARDEWQEERQKLTGRLDSIGSMLSNLGRANRTLLHSLDERTRERDDMGAEVARLHDRLFELQRDQIGVLARLDASTSDSVETMQRIITMAGLDLGQMLNRAGAPAIGRGGPFLEVAATEPASLLENQIDELDTRVEQWRGLRDLIERLPLTAPLDGYQITSTFGRRKDPFSGRLAMHEGTDFVGKSRALILAPAPGKVTFVGINGGYGKMVEIDHGFGIRTRYGHMNKIYVKRGQEIDFRQRLGQMGSTGRSTAEHLHYEIHVDGVPIDPEGFLRAGVFAFSG